MKRWVIILLTALLQEPVWAKNCVSLTVTSDPNYPPISWQDKQNPHRIIGVAIEIVELAMADKGVKVESKYKGPWKRVLASTDSVDMISGLYISEERRALLHFVQPPFMSDPNVIFVKEGHGFPFKSWEDLKGKKGGARLGDSFGVEFDEFAKQHLNLERVGQFEQLYGMTMAGRLDYFLYGLYPGISLAEELNLNRQLEFLPTPITEEGIYIAFSKTSNCIGYADYLSEKIKQYSKEGLLGELIQKYMATWEKQNKPANSPKVNHTTPMQQPETRLFLLTIPAIL
ncbi:ABC-type amino acid transport/signal transduction systems, periplasmic component/domain [Hahella chejuensis KCTC 2396]|uniref:ABC-type amino acid transport/signal transduction systems, periplasmic component/domain n=1 Tax=Hahella chejuensis (strain KCTC 2396) TaxID=349521 RepID=Q2SJJ0_HAHCH|nr:transporter substrate-binding domain-containing protein [Hahella chejuensis]ABC29184.1 ABC-type amino acid transport/signal transduction systems, periplasmic component/domain [Hahella chejuensis KCTC 2396]